MIAVDVPKPAVWAVARVLRWFGRVWLPDLAYVLFALAVTWSLLLLGGVPSTHDPFGWDRIETYRRAYLAGDLFPVWTPFSSNGHGSSHPLLYHRLYGQLFGALSLVTGVVRATKISIPFLYVVGAAGMRRLSLAHGAR